MKNLAGWFMRAMPPLERTGVSAALAFLCASETFKNQWVFRHSARNLPFRLSMNALSVGFPGIM